MKKDKVWSKPQLPCLPYAVCWVDCGCFLFCLGANYGWSTVANRSSPVFYKPDQIIIVKRSWKKDWLGFYLGFKKLLSKLIATAGPVLAKCKLQALGCRRKKKAEGEQGFMLVALCVVLPLLLVLISIFILISFWLKNFWAAQKNCEELTLSAQAEMAKLIPDLLRLNPEILKLKTQRTALRIKLAAAAAHGNVPAIASLTGQLKIIEARLLALWAQQNLILEKARLTRLRTLAQFKNQTKSYGVLQSQTLYHYPLPLGVAADQAFDPPPLYKVPDNFLEKQRLEIRWTQNLFQNGLQALLKILGVKKPLMRRACAASIEKNRPRLIKGKALSNLSY